MDEFGVALENDTSAVHTQAEMEQVAQIEGVLDDLFRERERVYRALAEGAY